MADKTITCPVDMSPKVSRLGTFANAFRVIRDNGDECFLDFCVYSAQENRAELVSRVRVNSSFLLIMLSRLGREVLEKGSLLPDGQLMLLTTVGES